MVSKNTIEIVEATLEHVQILGRTMNDEDRIESEAVGVESHRALWRGWKSSIFRYSALVDGEVAAMWGCYGGLLGGIGAVWLVTAKKAREISPHAFARIYLAEARKMQEIYPLLVNYVDNDYTKAKKMLKLAGFELDDPVPLGKFKRLFRKFHRSL